MASKSYTITASSSSGLEKKIEKTETYMAGENNTDYAVQPGDVPIVGWSYYFGYYLSSNVMARHRIAKTALATFGFTEGIRRIEPAGANVYTYQLTCRQKNAWDGASEICVLTSSLTGSAGAQYEKLAGMTAAGKISANTTEKTISISGAQAANAIAYGVAVVPERDAEIDDISDYVDINTPNSGNAEWFYERSEITADGVIITYTVENMAAPGAAEKITPSAASILVANRANTITWTYTHEFEAAQYYVGITAQYLDTGETVEICRKYVINTASGAKASYTIPAGTLRSGKIRMTISAMPYDSANYYSDDDAIWTTGVNVDYTVKDAPDAGAVSCDGKPVPTVTWTSSAQAAFQVRFGDFDSGVIAGSGNSYTVPRIFDDGNYAVRIRTATAAGEWSEWTAETIVGIKNIPPAGSVVLSAVQFDNNVRITWESTVYADKFAVYRDGEMIAVQGGNAYVDRYSAGESVYMVRAVLGGYYVQSTDVMFTLRLKTDIISQDGGYTYKAMKYTEAPKIQTDAYSDDVTYQYYSGRSKPIAIFSGRYERTKRFSYLFKKRTDALELRRMRNRPVLIKTTRGCVIYGVMGEMQFTEGRMTAVSFAVKEIGREGEEVDYVP